MEWGIIDQIFFSAAEDNVNADWTIRHGRSATLFSALKSAPGKVLEAATTDQISSTLLSYLSSDRLALVENAMSGVAFFFSHLLVSGDTVPTTLLHTFAKVGRGDCSC